MGENPQSQHPRGTVIAQDEASAKFFGMPGAAIATGCVDFTLPLQEIASALISLILEGTELLYSDREQDVPAPDQPSGNSDILAT